MKKQRERKTKRMLSMLIAFALVIGLIGSMGVGKPETVDAATYEVKNLGSVSWGGSTVGHFEVNGAIAFCMEHEKRQPPGGTDLTEEVYNNVNVARALYYGWGGPAQWSGFTSEAMGIVVTSLTLDYFFTGNDHNLTDDFEAFLASQPVPPDDMLYFDKSKLSVRWDVAQQKQITDTVSVKYQGNGDNTTLNFTLPNGVTLIKSDGTKLTGAVSLRSGDVFHLEASADVGGTWSTGQVGHSWKYQPILFRTSSAEYQDLGQGRLVVDPAAQTSLTVDWLKFGKLEVRKVDDGSEFLDGAKFKLISADPNTGYADGVEYEVKDGKLDIENIPVGTYTLEEVLPPDSYGILKQTFQVVINPDETTEQIVVNKIKPTGEIAIYKTDGETMLPLEGAEFTLYAFEDIYDPITLQKLYDKGDEVDKVTTDKEGEAVLTAPVMGEYSMKETKAPDGYVFEDIEYVTEFRQQDYTTKVYTDTFNITNTSAEYGLIVMSDDVALLEFIKSATKSVVTGDDARYILPITMGLLVLSGAGALLTFRRREKFAMTIDSDRWNRKKKIVIKDYLKLKK